MRASSVHVVMRHAIVELQCVNVVIGVHIVVLVVVRVVPIFLVVILYSHSIFHVCFAVLEVQCLHPPSVTADRRQL